MKEINDDFLYLFISDWNLHHNLKYRNIVINSGNPKVFTYNWVTVLESNCRVISKLRNTLMYITIYHLKMLP